MQVNTKIEETITIKIITRAKCTAGIISSLYQFNDYTNPWQCCSIFQEVKNQTSTTGWISEFN